MCELFGDMTDLALEQCAFAYLDPNWRLLGTRLTEPGHYSDCAVPFRDVLADTLRLGASGVVMAHNHPGGDPTPSEADLAATERLSTVLKAIDVRLVDHVVLARDRWVSMRDLGLL